MLNCFFSDTIRNKHRVKCLGITARLKQYYSNKTDQKLKI